MRSIRGLPARGFLLILSALLSPAVTAQQPELSERAIRLDQSIQSLKDEVIELTREAQDVENEVLVPPHRRVSVYLAVRVRGLLLNEVAVTIDDQTPSVYHYDERDARALLSDEALQRVLTAAVAPGAHRIRLSYIGQYADAKPEEPPLSGSYEAIFDKDLRQTELEFTLDREGRFGGNPQLRMKQWRAGR